MDISFGVSGTLLAQMDGHPPCIVEPGAIVYENHSQDTRYTGPLDTAPTVSSTYGTGGNNQPFVVEADTPKTLKIRSGCEGGGKGPLIQEDVSATLSCNNDQTLFVPMQAYDICIKGGSSPRSRCNEVDISRALDCGVGDPVCNQGGTAVVEGPTYAMTPCTYTQIEREKVPTLNARDFKAPTFVNAGYSVRRLTPPNAPVSKVSLTGGVLGWKRRSLTAGGGVFSLKLNADGRHRLRKPYKLRAYP